LVPSYANLLSHVYILRLPNLLLSDLGSSIVFRLYGES